MECGSSSFGSTSSGGGGGATDMSIVVELINNLQNRQTRGRALLLLAKNRQVRDNLGPLLWSSFGTMAILLQEIIVAYGYLSTPLLTDQASTRVGNALALLQCVASHPNTKILFLKANLLMYIYPFLQNHGTYKADEYIRIMSLGVLGPLVKDENEQIVQYLVKSKVVPYCICCMEAGGTLSKTVAAYIVSKILATKIGLKYSCVLAERFFALVRVLGNMVEQLVVEGRLAQNEQKRLLKYIILCFYRLSKNPRASHGLKLCLPMRFNDSTFISIHCDDEMVKRSILQLLNNIATAQPNKIRSLVTGLVET